MQELGYRVYVLSGEPLWADDLTLLQAARALPASWKKGVYNWEYRDGVPVMRFPYAVGVKWLGFPAHALSYTLSGLACVAHVAKTTNFDLIHAHTSYTDGTAATLCGYLYRRPTVITEHTGPFSLLTQNRLVRWFTQRAVNRCVGLIAVSTSLLNNMREQIKIRPDLPRDVIPNIVDVSRFSPIEKSKFTDRFVLLWVGHLTAVKRVDRLLHAFRAAWGQNPKLFLRIVGGGELQAELQALCSELGIAGSVEFVGPVSRDDLPPYYADSDCTVVSSDTETFSVVCIEAMSSGRPVVATKCGGPEDIISDRSVGVLVGRSVEELAAGLLEIARGTIPIDPQKISDRARRLYSRAAVGREIKKVYDRAVARPPAPAQTEAAGRRA